MARKIVITSGKGGVGKTTVCAILGEKLAKLNKNVVILDLDFGLNNLDVVLGVEGKVTYNLEDVIEGRCRVKQAIISCRQNLSIIESGHSYGYRVTAQNIKLLIEGLNNYDFVLMDCPAGIDDGFKRAVAAADEAIIVVNPNISSLRDADKVINILSNYRLDGVYAVANRVRGDLISTGKILSVEDIEDVLKLPVIGAIPEDDVVLINKAKDVTFGEANTSYKMLAKFLLKNGGKVYDCESQYKGFFARFKKSIKKKA